MILGSFTFPGKMNPAAKTAGWEPLTIDAYIPDAENGSHWEFDNASLQGWLSQAPLPNMATIGTGSPLATFCMVNYGTLPELLEDANATIVGANLGFSIPKRGILIPSSPNTVGQGGGALPAPGGGYAFSMVSVSGRRFVPPHMMIRGVVNCNPGTAQPGPGPDSFATMLATLLLVTNDHP